MGRKFILIKSCARLTVASPLMTNNWEIQNRIENPSMYFYRYLILNLSQSQSSIVLFILTVLLSEIYCLFYRYKSGSVPNNRKRTFFRAIKQMFLLKNKYLTPTFASPLEAEVPVKVHSSAFPSLLVTAVLKSTPCFPSFVCFTNFSMVFIFVKGNFCCTFIKVG